MKEFDVTDGLDTNVWGTLNKAIERNDKDSISVLLSFFRKICRASLSNRKIKYFQQYIGFASRVYRQVYARVKEDTSYLPLVHLFSLELSLHLKEIIWFNIGLEGKTAKTIAEKKIINLFYYEAFKSFNDLFYLSMRYQDWPMFHEALKDFNQLAEGAFDIDIQDKLKLASLSRENKDGKNDAAIAELDQQQQIAYQYENYKRQVLSGLKCWCYLLFEQNIIAEDSLTKILTKIINYPYEPQNEIKDILFFRSGDLKYYMNWENWDYMDRPEHETYYPPMPGSWMTKGFFLDRIRNNNAYFNTDKINPLSLKDIPFLYDSLLESLNSIRPEFEKWKSILKTESIEEFDQRARNLLASVSQAKRITIGNKEHVIANSELSNNKIQEFKELVGKAWKGQTRIRKVFDHFDNKENVTGQDIKLKRVGQNSFLEKGKMVFIEGEYHSPIYGIEQFGGNVGRWEDELFFEVIQKSVPGTTTGATVMETLDKAIQKLKSNKVTPNVILIEAQYLYKDEEFLKSERYSGFYDPRLNPDDIQFFVLGTFDNIPLFSSMSPLLKNKVVVAEFNMAFSMKYKTNNNWFENELSINVELVTTQQANERLIKEPRKWKITNDGIEISDEDAITLIKTSIVIDMETIIDYTVKDINKFIVGYITEPNAD
ncbi:hypothetical protein ACFFGT_10500 [Mucilaginibacter angelicae]|uniref:Uncharacterized protein n=1 Tax=Mucilaginibacter angelicae TaxID=869718 RepID=A0ABV6L5A6_9SPHI